MSQFIGLKSQFIEMFKDCQDKVSIGEICKVVSGKSIPKNLEDNVGDIAYVKVADFNISGNEKFITTSSRFVDNEAAKMSKTIPKGSVIFAKNGAASLSNKKRLTLIDCCIDMNTMALIPNNDQMSSDFLYSVIESMDLREYVRQGAIPSMDPKSFADVSIYCPSATEQMHFVNISQQADKSGYYN